MQANRCSEVCPHLSVFQIAKLFDSTNQIGIDDDFSDNENILLGMNIPNRYAFRKFHKPIKTVNYFVFEISVHVDLTVCHRWNGHFVRRKTVKLVTNGVAVLMLCLISKGNTSYDLLFCCLKKCRLISEFTKKKNSFSRVYLISQKHDFYLN